jgi:hypothetical protein
VRGLNISGQATSTSNVGFNITTGCFAIAGSCLSHSNLGGTVALANGGTNATSFAPNSIVTVNAAGDTLIATGTQLTVGNILATTTAQNYFNGNISIASSTPFGQLSVNSLAGSAAFVVGSSTKTSFIVDKFGNVGVGTTTPSAQLAVKGAGSAVGLIIQGSNGASELADFYGNAGTINASIGDDGAFGIKDGSKLYLDSGTRGGITYFQESGGINFVSGAGRNITLNSSGYNAFLAGGVEAMRIISSGNVGIGTTTPYLKLNIASTTQPQLSLEGADTDALYTFRSIGGSLYIATSSPTTYATTSISALEISSTGTTTLRGLNISALATSTSNVGLNITTGCFAVGGNCIGGGSFSNTLAGGGTATTTFYSGGVVFSDASKLTQSAAAANFFWDETNKKLGLGTSTPFAKLSINQLTGQDGLTIGSSSATSFIVNKFGNVGIGEANPTAALQITNPGGVRLQNTTSDFNDMISYLDSSAYHNVLNAASLSIETNTSAGNTTSGTVRLFINNADGNVGISTTTPFGLFGVNPSGIVGPEFVVGSSTKTDLIISNSGNVGVGTTTPFGSFGVNSIAGQVAFAVGSSTKTSFIVDKFGNVGVGTTSPWRAFDINGTVGMKGLTTSSGTQSGVLCISSTNEVINDSVACIASSGRFKEGITDLSGSSALSEVMALRPVAFKYKASFNGALQNNPNYSNEQVGFIAEDVQKLDPRLVEVETATTTFDGVEYPAGTPHTVRYENMTAILASAMQEMNLNIESLASTTATSTPQSQVFVSSFFNNLFGRITTWLADAGNGIGKLFAQEVNTKSLCVTDDGGGKTCINKSQLDALLAGAGSAGGSSAGNQNQPSQPPVNNQQGSSTPVIIISTSTPDTTAPVITLVGSTTTTIAVGSSYIDPGATVTDTDSTGAVNNNLGIHVSVDGVEMQQVTIDTSTSSTHAIVYTATDGAGNSGTTTRRVNVISQ